MLSTEHIYSHAELDLTIEANFNRPGLHTVSQAPSLDLPRLVASVPPKHDQAILDAFFSDLLNRDNKGLAPNSASSDNDIEGLASNSTSSDSDNEGLRKAIKAPNYVSSDSDIEGLAPKSTSSKSYIKGLAPNSASSDNDIESLSPNSTSSVDHRGLRKAVKAPNSASSVNHRGPGGVQSTAPNSSSLPMRFDPSQLLPSTEERFKYRFHGKIITHSDVVLAFDRFELEFHRISYAERRFNALEHSFQVTDHSRVRAVPYLDDTFKAFISSLSNCQFAFTFLRSSNQQSTGFIEVCYFAIHSDAIALLATCTTSSPRPNPLNTDSFLRVMGYIFNADDSKWNYASPSLTYGRSALAISAFPLGRAVLIHTETCVDCNSKVEFQQSSCQDRAREVLYMV